MLGSTPPTGCTRRFGAARQGMSDGVAHGTDRVPGHAGAGDGLLDGVDP